ncbi:MAG TPA: hypothetical protein VHK01_12210 [Lacipirellulaceae bacterium]|jgi:hypothetical protein|nr:hypothetical protein [Lacipirellulaceae bacterium]
MATANGICNRTVAGGSIVLMARIVDGAGAAIRPSDVVAIEYSACEVDPFWPEQLTVVRGHHAVPLDTRDVLLDSPQVGRFWSLDDVGYNFRHELTFDSRERSPSAEQRFEVVYQLTMKNGSRTTVRFKLRCSMAGEPPPQPSPQGGGSLSAISRLATGVNHDRY